MKFEIISPDRESVRFELTPERPAVTIGRETPSGGMADILVNSVYVAQRHCRLTLDDDGARLEPLNNHCSFFVDGEKQDEPRLNPGDEVVISGETKLRALVEDIITP